ncbi:MAG TPA: hypothetical protein VLF91_04345 [Candidatus Saccharimonadales bacterium]|nr:hypothetical protein [Candidatus Saccharimonadales bacterium]
MSSTVIAALAAGVLLVLLFGTAWYYYANPDKYDSLDGNVHGFISALATFVTLVLCILFWVHEYLVPKLVGFLGGVMLLLAILYFVWTVFKMAGRKFVFMAVKGLITVLYAAVGFRAFFYVLNGAPKTQAWDDLSTGATWVAIAIVGLTAAALLWNYVADKRQKSQQSKQAKPLAGVTPIAKNDKAS